MKYRYGLSGIGKTTTINALNTFNPKQFHILSPNNLKWDQNKSIVSHFKNHHPLLGQIGLNSVRSRLSNFDHLSQGEQYRVIIAHLIKDSLIINPLQP